MAIPLQNVLARSKGVLISTMFCRLNEMLCFFGLCSDLLVADACAIVLWTSKFHNFGVGRVLNAFISVLKDLREVTEPKKLSDSPVQTPLADTL